MIKSDQQHITQHKRFTLRAHANFGFSKTSFMLGPLAKMPIKGTSLTRQPLGVHCRQKEED